jgi:phosphoesterase RecJ-like protein
MDEHSTAAIGHSRAEVVAMLNAARRWAAICHENPDADTIGAAVALVLIGERLGKETELVSADEIPPLFAFLPRVMSAHAEPQSEPDLAIICDAANLERVGRMATSRADWFRRARIMNIDHHISNELFGDVNHVDPAAAATCQVIAELLPDLGIEPDAEIATALLTGIVSDSRGFADTSTSSNTLRVTASLLQAGGPLSLVSRRLLHEMPYSTMALWGRLLADMRQEMGGRIVHTTLTGQMLADTGTRQHQADGVADLMRQVRGADVTILLRELGATSTRVSLRTRRGVDATRIAAAFGGGGHATRAGFVADEPETLLRQKLLALCERSLAEKGH